MKQYKNAFFRSMCAGLALSGIFVIGWFGWDSLLGNRPIRFYGRVVDRNGSGVAGVVIRSKITYIPLLSRPDPRLWNRERTFEVQAVTDAEGRFAIRSHGISLNFTDWNAPGLALWNGGGGIETTFTYQAKGYPPMPIHDDPNHPYVYLMVPVNSPDAKWIIDRGRTYGKVLTGIVTKP